MPKKTLKTNSALLEIGTEEIPARFMPGFLDDLKAKAEKELNDARLKFSAIKTFGTGRRLILYVENLSPKQDDISEERKGPPKERAYGPDGKPNQAAIGFAKSLGLKTEQLTTKVVGGKEYLFARVETKGLPAEKVLSQVFPNIIASLYLPISMKWGSGEGKFIRPIHWILALCGNKVVNFAFGDIKASNSTFGHRYVSGSKPIRIVAADIEVFGKALKKAGVVIDQDEREKMIASQVNAAAKSAKGEAIVDDDLLNEVNFLVEYPSAAAGNFDPAYLALPKDILITTMKKNQKYFPVTDSAGKLKASFIVIADCFEKGAARSTVGGNERVISARLADAKFFFDEDKKKPLASRIDETRKVSFQDKLGTMYDKSKRVIELANFIAKELKLDDGAKAKIRRIAELSKADLVTKMVFEFGELQGVMGREYALLSGEDKGVAVGIFEHYLPRYAGDILPSSIEGTVVSIADKLDSIVGCFSVGLVHTGSQDPYGLRRQAHGIVEMILKKALSLSLEDTVEKSYKLYEPIFLEYLLKRGETGYKDFAGIRRAALEFIASRLRGIMLDGGVRYDVADAALSAFSDVLFDWEKAKVITKNLGSELLKGIVMTSDRVSRIAKGAPRELVVEADFMEDAERSLYDLYMKVNWEVGTAIEGGDIQHALEELNRMTKPVDQFFEKILVMHENERVKANRLALLRSIELMYLSVGDFPKIVIQKAE